MRDEFDSRSSAKKCRKEINHAGFLEAGGEKRIKRETHDSTYQLMERAYGSFQRAFPLPENVNADKAVASYKNGVLTVRLPKEAGANAKCVPVS